MTRTSLILKNLRHFRWSNVAVCAGVIVATAVLTGALMVGDSVRGSLRDLTLQRLGPIDDALIAPRFFNADLAERIAKTREFQKDFAAIHAGIITHGGAARSDESARTAGVQIAAIEGDWVQVPQGGSVINGELATSLNAVKPGDNLLFSLPILQAGPLDATLARRGREDVTSNLRADCKQVATEPGVASMFNLAGGQRLPRNAWVNLSDLQSAVGQEGRANSLLVQEKSFGSAPEEQQARTKALQNALNSAITLADYGISATPSPDGRERVINSADTYFISPLMDAAESVASQKRVPMVEASSYLINTATNATDSAAIHYAMIAGLSSLDGKPIADDQVILNQWAADHLHAKVGDSIKLDYYVRDRTGGTREVSAPRAFKVARILPMTGEGADPSLTPTYKGLTDSDSVSDWHAPEGITIRKDWVTPDDDAYWKKYRAAPKLLISLAAADRLWHGPFGLVTSIRVPTDQAVAFEEAFRQEIVPESMGLSLRPIKADQLAATSGSTDFAGLFIGFSFFLIAAAVLLVAMLFRLNVEQRARQLGLMAALGFRAKSLRRMALTEGLLIAVVGAALGTLAAIGYTALMMLGLRTWWVGAVGTTQMRLHVEPMTLVYGFVGSVIIAGLAILWGVWRVGRTPAARLLSGAWATQEISTKRRRWIGWIGWLGVVGGLAMLGSMFGKTANPETVLSGSALLLFALLTVISVNLRPRRSTSGRETVTTLGFRNAARHSARSVVTMGLIALATFALVIVASMRGQAGEDVADKKSGAGGYRLMLTADVPLTGDLNVKAGRSALGVANPDDALWSKAHFTSLRRWRGEDISCLNLMKPGSPTILAVPREMAERKAFTFVRSTKKVDNKWTLLDGTVDNAIPVIADDETAEYILHLGLGESLTVTDQTGTPRKLTLVATLAGSVFQGELLMGEANFATLFPSQGGAGVAMVETDAADAPLIAQLLGKELADFSVTVDPTADVLARYRNVQNTYLATFQVLGSLGLLLGTIGLAVVLLRGIVERKSELAMLAAIGFKRMDRLGMVLAENALLLVLGLAVGAACAVAGTLPVLLHSARHVHVLQLLLALLGILVAGMISLVIAVWFGGRRIGPADLRSE